MVNWLSEHRSDIALIVIIGLVISFIWSIFYGVKRSRILDKEQVFGDPERTLGGWYWAVCGVSALMLVWFYTSWGAARALFPTVANETCQIAKIDEGLSSINARLLIDTRYYKSTTLIVRNTEQLNQLQARLPAQIFNSAERSDFASVFAQSFQLLAVVSDPALVSPNVRDGLKQIEARLAGLEDILNAGWTGLSPSADAADLPRWGVANTEIALTPKTAQGVMYDNVAQQAALISADFVKLRHIPIEAEQLIDKTKQIIARLKAANKAYTGSEADIKARKDYLKAVERIFKRLDDGTIFPAESLDSVHQSVTSLSRAIDDSKGWLAIKQAVFMPAGSIVKSKTLCRTGRSKMAAKTHRCGGEIRSAC